MTEYVVLALDRSDDEKAWTEAGRVQARSSRAAIRTLFDEQHSRDVNISVNGYSYVAVPARSWQPQLLKVETKTQLKFQ